jgi:hypothetical protein
MTISTKKNLRHQQNFILFYFFHPYLLGYHGNKIGKRELQIAFYENALPLAEDKFSLKIIKQGILKISTSGLCLCLGQALIISRTPHSL